MRKHCKEPISIDPPGPRYMACDVILFRPLLFQKSFGLSISPLLPPVPPNGIATVVPHHGSRTKSELPTPLLEAPTDIHIISCNTEPFVETSYLQQRGFAESHVASRNVFCFAISQQHMDGPAGRVAHALFYPVTRRRNIGASDADV